MPGAQNMPKNTKGRWLTLVFLAFLVIVFAVIISVMLNGPMDPGMVPGNTSANLNYGGNLLESENIVYFCKQDGVYQRNFEDNTQTKIYDGTCSSLNIMEGWLYFICNGDIVRVPPVKLTDYQGETIVEGKNCQRISVNGSWIFYTDAQGVLYKVMVDGSNNQQISQEGTAVIRFTVDGKIVVFQTQQGIYHMLTDGSGVQPLVEQPCGMFVYTADSLYYEQDGKVERIYSAVGGADGSQIAYEPRESKVFSYQVSGTESLLYYLADDGGIYVESLETLTLKGEEPQKLCDMPDTQAIYLADRQIYLQDSSGDFYHMNFDGTELKSLSIE